MMTKQSSRKRINILMAGVIPVVLGLVMALGQPLIAQDGNSNVAITKDEYFNSAIIHYQSEDGNMMMTKYVDLPTYIKKSLPHPPPPPPLPPGKDGECAAKVNPLPEGTIVQLKENGSVVIGNDHRDDIDFPLPPPVPPAASNSVAPVPPQAPTPPSNVAPVAPQAPVAPKAPKGLSFAEDGSLLYNGKTVRELAEAGAEVYLNGNLLNQDVAKTLCDDNKYNDIWIAGDESSYMRIDIRDQE